MSKHRPSRDDDLERELRVHLELEAEEARERGLPDSAARAAARRAFGSVLKTKEETRAMWSGMWLERVWQDASYAIRTLRKTPAFTAVALLTLALGIGANTAMFSLVNGVILRPLGYRDADRLVAVHERIPAISRTQPLTPVNFEHFREWRASNRSFEDMAIIGGVRMNLTGSGDPQTIPAARVSSNLFAMLGVSPALGRTFTADEQQHGRDHVVLLSNDLWRRQFASDPRIVGRTITLDDEQYDVIGVLPPAFRFPQLRQLYNIPIGGEQPQMWKPFVASEQELDPGGEFNFACIGRLAAGVSIPQAVADMDAVQTHVAESMRGKPELHVAIVPLQEQITGRSRSGLELLLLAIGVVLLIGCVNLANLLLARTAARRRELALRAALGASRSRLAGQMVVEAMLLALVGGALGAALGYAGNRALVAMLPIDVPRVDEIRVDARVLLFTFVVSALAGLLVSVLPVLRLSRLNPRDALQSGAGRTSANSAQVRLRMLLVVAEVGMSAVCLIMAGLLLRSFANIVTTDRGFDAQRVLTVDLALPATRYADTQTRVDLVRSLLEDLRSVPGIVSAGASNKLPLTGGGASSAVFLEGVVPSASELTIADYRQVNPGYFRTLAIPLRRGRFFDDADRDKRVAVVSAAAALRLWPGQDPLGKRFFTSPVAPKLVEVVGVVSDVHDASLEKAPGLTIYEPYWQDTPPRLPPAVSLAFRTEANADSVASSVRRIIQHRDPELALPAFRTMDDVVGTSVSARRAQLELILLFAGTAILLASMGIYGVASYAVLQRTNEIGIRVALGARPFQIRRLVLGQALAPVALGLTCGVLAAIASGRLLNGLLYGVSPNDPLTLMAVAALIAIVAVAANYVPARRATRVDPLVALRSD